MDAIRIRKGIGLFLYNCFGKYLPVSFCRIGGKFGKRFRGFCARLILDSCGRDVNVERKALFSSRIHLGDHSGIGINASIGGKVIIGNDVMMGPNCTIYCRNHQFSRTDVTMRGQGFQEERPVTIEDDVWIGGKSLFYRALRSGMAPWLAQVPL